MIELKLDATTMFEWQRHSQESTEVPPYTDLLDFLSLRAQASETHHPEVKKFTKGEVHTHKKGPHGKPVASFVGNASASTVNRILCEKDKHPLFVCPKFENLPHDQMILTL